MMTLQMPKEKEQLLHKVSPPRIKPNRIISGCISLIFKLKILMQKHTDFLQDKEYLSLTLFIINKLKECLRI